MERQNEGRTRSSGMKFSDMFNLVVDEDMPDDEILFKFPEGQEHKNIRIINVNLGKTWK